MCTVMKSIAVIYICSLSCTEKANQYTDNHTNPSGHVVLCPHILGLLKHWDHGFKSHSSHGCMSALLCCAVLCRYRSCNGLITSPRSLTNMSKKDSQFQMLILD